LRHNRGHGSESAVCVVGAGRLPPRLPPVEPFWADVPRPGRFELAPVGRLSSKERAEGGTVVACSFACNAACLSSSNCSALSPLSIACQASSGTSVCVALSLPVTDTNASRSRAGVYVSTLYPYSRSRVLSSRGGCAAFSP